MCPSPGWPLRGRRAGAATGDRRGAPGGRAPLGGDREDGPPGAPRYRARVGLRRRARPGPCPDPAAARRSAAARRAREPRRGARQRGRLIQPRRAPAFESLAGALRDAFERPPLAILAFAGFLRGFAAFPRLRLGTAAE